MSATWDPTERSWTVTLWSSAATSVSLFVIDRSDPFVAISVTSMERSGSTWSATIAAADVGDADLYGFRVDGPVSGRARFDRSKMLVDPEATEIWFPPSHDRDAARVVGKDTHGRSPLGVLPHSVPKPPAMRAPLHPTEQLVIYEVHVRGATMHAPHVEIDRRGTFAGLVDDIPRLVSLGVTAVELLPVHQFDPAEGNYWGYMPLGWYALHHAYVQGHDPQTEFRQMVAAFHDAGIEVILDVVYNHTTEEDEVGPTYHLRAIDDCAYYVMHDDGSYRDDAGCGNVLRAAHPAASALVMGSLRHMADMGVDGFRFDLGSLLGRDLDGRVQHDSALIDEITAFATDRNVRLIVEPWDLTSYQIGDAFPGRTWAQWNGQFRDDCRSFLRAEPGSTSSFARSILGSPHLYGDAWQRSINFVTAHDGFTLYDLVSYERKHNEANGQNGNDGTDDNRSWNCGHEGDDIPGERAAEVVRLRMQQMKNAFVLLTLSAGVPMMLAGDEFAQTQRGNNNAFNQDNETTWLGWQRADTFRELTDFVSELIHLRNASASGPIGLHGVDESPDLGYTSFSIAWQRGDLYVMANAWWEPLTFGVHADGEWGVALSSAAATGELAGRQITLAPRSTVVLRRV